MGEGLELLDPFLIGVGEEPVFRTISEVAALVHDGVGLEPELGGRFFHGGKVDIGGDVLLAWEIERVGVRFLVPVAAKSASGAGRVVK